MESIPLVSIIMPTFNCELFIPESIKSVLAQSFANWELIIVDDGSTDNTAKVVESFLEDKRITYVYQTNGRQSKARNNGLRYAKGSFVAFLDSDDLWETQKLEVQIKKIESEDIDVVFSDGVVIGESKEVLLSEIFRFREGYYFGEEGLLYFIKANRIPMSSALVKKSAIDSIGNFNECLEIQNCEDYDVWLKLLSKGYKFYAIKDKLIKYRRHANASTSTWIKLLPPELYLIENFNCTSAALNEIKLNRLCLLYRDLFGILIDDRNSSSRIKNHLKGFRKWTKWYKYSILQLSLKLHPTLFKIISWRII